MELVPMLHAPIRCHTRRQGDDGPEPRPVPSSSPANFLTSRVFNTLAVSIWKVHTRAV